jgi:hypothetical protein
MKPLAVLVCIENINEISYYGHMKARHALILVSSWKWEWLSLGISCSCFNLQNLQSIFAFKQGQQTEQSSLP